MSNIDKHALNQEKIEWLNKLADMEYCKSNPWHWLMSLKDTTMLAQLALHSQALLDELEAKDRNWAAQDDHINQQADLIESLEKKNGDLGRALRAAEKRIAELEARQVDLEHIGYIQVEEGAFYLDESMVKSAICAAGIRINGED